MGDLPPSYEAATGMSADQSFLGPVPPKPSAPTTTATPTSLQTTVAPQNRRKCFWLTIIVIALIAATFIIAVINAQVTKQHKPMLPDYPKYDWDAYNVQNNPLTEYKKSGWDSFNKNHQELLDRLKNRDYK